MDECLLIGKELDNKEGQEILYLSRPEIEEMKRQLLVALNLYELFCGYYRISLFSITPDELKGHELVRDLINRSSKSKGRIKITLTEEEICSLREHYEEITGSADYTELGGVFETNSAISVGEHSCLRSVLSKLINLKR